MNTHDSRSSVPLWSHMVRVRRVRRVRTLSLQNIFALYVGGFSMGIISWRGWASSKSAPFLCFENQKNQVLNPAPSLSLSQKQASFCPQTWNPSASCASSSRMVPQVRSTRQATGIPIRTKGTPRGSDPGFEIGYSKSSYRSSCSQNSENKRPDCRPEYSLLAGPSVQI